MRCPLLAVVSAAALLGLAAGSTGCGATAAHTLGPTQAFLAQPAAGDTGALTTVDTLRVSPRGQLLLQPLWFTGRLSTGGAYAPFAEGTRVQVVLRVRHPDASVTTWTLTSPDGALGQAMALGRGGPDARFHVPLGERRIGPIAARDVAALEVLVSTLDAPDPAPVARGGAALAEAPDLRAAPQALSAAAAHTRSAHGALELAVQLPVRIDPAQAPEDGDHHWLVLVEAEPAADAPPTDEDARRLDRVARLSPAGRDGALPVADDTGRALPGTSAIAFSLRIVQPPQGPRRDGPRDRAPKGKDERHRRVPPREVAEAPR